MMKHSISIAVLMALSGIITPATATASEEECSAAILQCNASSLAQFVSPSSRMEPLSGNDISTQLSSLKELAGGSGQSIGGAVAGAIGGGNTGFGGGAIPGVASGGNLGTVAGSVIGGEGLNRAAGGQKNNNAIDYLNKINSQATQYILILEQCPSSKKTTRDPDSVRGAKSKCQAIQANSQFQ